MSSVRSRRTGLRGEARPRRVSAREARPQRVRRPPRQRGARRAVTITHPFARSCSSLDDFEAALSTLADDVVFRSPAVYKPYEGKRAGGNRCCGSSPAVFENFRYAAEWRDGRYDDPALRGRTSATATSRGIDILEEERGGPDRPVHRYDQAALGPAGAVRGGRRCANWVSSRSLVKPSYDSCDYADVAQLARASACHPEGREFESLHPLKTPAKRGFSFPAPG